MNKKCFNRNLVNQRFGKLIVLEKAPDRVVPSGQHKKMWLCKCDCGTVKSIDEYSLIKGRTKSCNCEQKRIVSIINHSPNKFEEYDNFMVGWTNKGEAFFFDKEAFSLVKEHTWYITRGNNNDGYVMTSLPNGKHLLLHRLIMNYSGKNDIDHIHGRATRNDNRISNLRIATRSQNNMNKNIAHSNTGVLGVHKVKKTNMYFVTGRSGRYISIHHNLEDAITARKEYEKTFGEWSYDNSQTSDKSYINPNKIIRSNYGRYFINKDFSREMEMGKSSN